MCLANPGRFSAWLYCCYIFIEPRLRDTRSTDLCRLLVPPVDSSSYETHSKPLTAC
jgi:hypothetical protein